jgi:hypothetical protein
MDLNKLIANVTAQVKYRIANFTDVALATFCKIGAHDSH